MADPVNMTGKVVIDTTNPLDFSQGLPQQMAVGIKGLDFLSLLQCFGLVITSERAQEIMHSSY